MIDVNAVLIDVPSRSALAFMGFATVYKITPERAFELMEKFLETGGYAFEYFADDGVLNVYARVELAEFIDPKCWTVSGKSLFAKTEPDFQEAQIREQVMDSINPIFIPISKEIRDAGYEYARDNGLRITNDN